METAMPDSKRQLRRLFTRGPWLSIWSLFLGVLFFAATAIGGHVGRGFISLGLFIAFAAIFYFGRANETIDGLSSPRRDERWEMINQRALAFAGTVLVLTLIGGWLVELVNGNDGSPYSLVLAGGVLAYFAGAL